MINTESLADVVNKSAAEVRNVMQDVATRLETEVKKMAGAVGVDDEATDRVRDAGSQLQNVVDMIRTEATTAAGQFTEGVTEVVEEFRGYLADSGSKDGGSTGPAVIAGAVGAASGTAAKVAKKAATNGSSRLTGTDATKAPAGPTAKKAAKKSTAKKSTAKKSTVKKAVKKNTAKKSTAKKSTAKKSTAKKAVKKAPAKKAVAKKAAKKAPAKKAAAKKSAKKSTAKKAAKKTAAK